jgi:hypothetical protein
MVPSQSASLAFDADAPFNPPDHVVGQPIQQARIDACG